MKKLFIALVVLFSISLGYSLGFFNSFLKKDQLKPAKNVILTVGLVADSHTEGELLAKALTELKWQGADFIIGLGDYTNLGTLDELTFAKSVFDKSSLKYFVIPGDRDGWDSRQNGEENIANFSSVFKTPGTQIFENKGVSFVLVDNSDLYKGISGSDWAKISSALSTFDKLTLVFAHKTPFHPDSAHIMGEDDPSVGVQAREFLKLLEDSGVDGFFSGDLHFFAHFKTPGASVRITTIGAVASARNFQGPRFAILKIYDDYSFDVVDYELK